MRYFALALDYDGTIAQDGKVSDATVAALRRVLASGRQLILVSGRELEDLLKTFDHLELFSWAVLENGALLYRPASKEEKLIGDRPSEAFVAACRQRGIERDSVGRVIYATWRPHEVAVLEAIQECGLELQIIFNKDAVMVLPTGISKATGLAAALKEIGLSPHNVVGAGDAENDHAFLSLCECSVAVENALPAVKRTADFTTAGHHGFGVTELIDELIDSDLQGRDFLLSRHHLLFGRRDDGRDVRFRPYGNSILFSGPSGSGKSTAASSFVERLLDYGYQFCIIDPEGDYESFEGTVSLGNAKHGPSIDEVMKLVAKPGANASINLVGMPISERPKFFMELLPRLQELRTRTGRPHWIVVDEAHHLFPTTWDAELLSKPQALDRLVLITVHPAQVSPSIMEAVDTVVAVGKEPHATLGEFCTAVKSHPPRIPRWNLQPGEVMVWTRSTGEVPYRATVLPCRTERHRHVRKYAEGELPPDRSFYFKGPGGKLKLRAQNLLIFLQIADGVDDETWLFHLGNGDVAAWFRDKIKDAELAATAEAIANENASAEESRARIRAAVEKRYTVPEAPNVPMPGTDNAAAAQNPKKPAGGAS